MREWGRFGLVNLVETPSPYCWLNRIGSVLLYDWPTLEFFNDIPYEVGLFGNCDPPANGKDNRRWTFWPKHPTLTLAYHEHYRRSFKQRPYRVTFIGGQENWTQRGYRQPDYWKRGADLFEYTKYAKNKYTIAEYLRLLGQSRFGLCLRGYGPKCCREIECMAMGAVPIITPGVSMRYFEPPVLGKHYFYVESVDELEHVVHTVSEEQWNEMSQCCRSWYERNASPSGILSVTARSAGVS